MIMDSEFEPEGRLLLFGFLPVFLMICLSLSMTGEVPPEHIAYRSRTTLPQLLRLHASYFNSAIHFRVN